MFHCLILVVLMDFRQGAVRTLAVRDLPLAPTIPDDQATRFFWTMDAKCDDSLRSGKHDRNSAGAAPPRPDGGVRKTRVSAPASLTHSNPSLCLLLAHSFGGVSQNERLRTINRLAPNLELAVTLLPVAVIVNPKPAASSFG